MALKQVVKDLEELEENLRELYVPGKDPGGNDVFFLDAEEPNGLRQAVGRLKTQARSLQERLDTFGELDPEEVKQALSDLETLRSQETDVSRRLEAVKSEMAKTHQREAEAIKAERDRYRNALLESRVSDAAHRAIVEAKGRPKLLSPVVERQLRLIERDGRFQAIVVDEAGNERIGDAHGNPMSIDQLIAELKQDPDYATAFDGRQKSGLDTPGDTPRRQPKEEWKPGGALTRLRNLRRNS